MSLTQIFSSIKMPTSVSEPINKFAPILSSVDKKIYLAAAASFGIAAFLISQGRKVQRLKKQVADLTNTSALLRDEIVQKANIIAELKVKQEALETEAQGGIENLEKRNERLRNKNRELGRLLVKHKQSNQINPCLFQTQMQSLADGQLVVQNHNSVLESKLDTLESRLGTLVDNQEAMHHEITSMNVQLSKIADWTGTISNTGHAINNKIHAGLIGAGSAFMTAKKASASFLAESWNKFNDTFAVLAPT